MKKKMTLDLTWELCLRMWKWIAENWQEDRYVCAMKTQWLRQFWAGKPEPKMGCFFCDYHKKHGSGDITIPGDLSGCEQCPGRLVSGRFHCEHETYSWVDNPKRFYKKLLMLDAKRNQK